MKDSDCDVVVNDLLCFISNYGSRIPKEILKQTIRRHFDSEAVVEAGKVVGLPPSDFTEVGVDLDRFLDLAVAPCTVSGRIFAATNLSALPLVVKVEQEEVESQGGKDTVEGQGVNSGSDSDVLVKILSEVQSLRRLVNELRSPGHRPNFSSAQSVVGADGAVNGGGSLGDCTDSEASPGQNFRDVSGRRKPGLESTCSAQGGASLEDTIKRLKERKPSTVDFLGKEREETESKSANSSLSSSAGCRSGDGISVNNNLSPKERSGNRDREKIPLPNSVVETPPSLPPHSMFLPRFPNTYAQLYNSSPEVFSDPANIHWLRTWLFLTAQQQAQNSHNQQQTSNLFPPFLGPQPPPGSGFGVHSPLVKMDTTEPPVSDSTGTPGSLKSPAFRNGQSDNCGTLKQEDSEPSTGSPTDDPLMVDTTRGGEDDDYPSPEDDDPLDSRNSQILNDAIDKPYVCQYTNCHKRFANKFLLKKHEFIHTGERPHQCPFCGKRFNRKDNLLRHKKTHLANAFNNPKRRHTLVFGVRGEGADNSETSGAAGEMDLAQQLIRQHGLLQAQQEELVVERAKESVVSAVEQTALRNNNNDVNSFGVSGEQISIS